MEFKFRAIDGQASTYRHPPSSFSSSNFSYFTEQALRARYSASDYGRGHDFFHKNPNDVREAIQREIEKERIREEIIAAEIARKRLLEAEVRREMVMEREMALRRAAADGSSSSSRLWICHQSEGSRSLEERIAMSLEERLGYSFSARRQIGGFEPSSPPPFKRNAEPRISELKPPSEVSKEKVVLLAKPEANLSGAKRKAVTPPGVGDSELRSVSLKKKPKEEWSCAMCQVSATSERGLNEHLQGKKHKSKEAGLRAQRTGKNFGLGLCPKKTAKPTKLVEITDNASSERVVKIEGGSLKLNKTESSLLQKKYDEPLLQINQDADGSKKNREGRQKMQKTAESKKKKFKFWCEMCQIGAFSEKVMDTHKKGKKHVTQLQELDQNGGAVPNTQMAKTTQKVNDAEEVAKDGKRNALEKVDGTADGVNGFD